MLIQTEGGGIWLVQFHFRNNLVDSIQINNKKVDTIILQGDMHKWHKGYKGYFCEEKKDLLRYNDVYKMYTSLQVPLTSEFTTL